jgi:hypothetical protein
MTARSLFILIVSPRQICKAQIRKHLFNSKRMFSIYLILTSFLLFSGCGSSGSKELRERGRGSALSCRALLKYPTSDYFHMKGEGRTLQEADDRGRAEISRIISSEIAAKVSVSAQQGGSQDQEQISEEIQVSTRFAHAELIKSIKKCSRCRDGLCEVRLILNRSSVANRLVSELGPDAKRFSQSTSDLTEDASILRFSQAWYVAHGSYQRMRPLLNQLKVIGRMPAHLIRAESEMRSAQAIKAKRYQRLWVLVSPLELNPSPIPATGLRSAVSGRLSQAIETLGLKVWPHTGCPSKEERSASSPPEVIEVTPRGVLKCALGFIGPQCQLAMNVTLSMCPEQRLGSEDWSHLKLAGVHPQDQAVALKRLVQRVSQQDFTQALAKAISPFIVL